MSVNESTLQAYVDGELDRAGAAEVEKALVLSEDLQRQERLLRAARLPCADAFAAQNLPEMPPALRLQLESWIALADESGSEFAPSKRRWLGIGAGLAASFAAGLWVPAPLRLNPVAAQDPPWIQAIARYQALYVRETVDRTSEEPERARTLLASFAADGGRHASIPDLRAWGLTLRRVQRLAVDESPLIHIEYLPAKGKPVSLCILAVRRVDAGVVTRRVAGLGVSTWRSAGLEFVMVADMPVSEVAGLAERVASGEFPTLYRS
jgi:anti-sigma factor RsiW